MDRTVIKMVKGRNAVDGAGVHLVRVLGPDTIKEFDPILMLDSFDSKEPKKYTAGFPIHPHRGIETISYVSKGKMKHRDNLGFSDTVNDGEVQWMTAGSGILHEELIPESEHLLGVQLWLNLPKKDKMTKPKYHAIKANDIKEIKIDGGKLRLLAGNYKENKGFQSNHLPFDYYDIQLEENVVFTIETEDNRSVMVFTLVGDIMIGDTLVAEKTAVKLSQGDSLTIKTRDKKAQVLFISSKALNEKVAWGGPVVMNTQEELALAFEEMRNNTFIK